MATAKRRRSKIAGTCDPVLARIATLRVLLHDAQGELDRAEESRRAILEIGVRAIRDELTASSRRLRRAG